MFTPSSTYNSNNPYPYPYSSSSSFSSYPLVHHPLLSNIIPDTINNNASPSANTCFLLHDPALPLPFIPNPSPLISETLTNLQAQPLVSDYAPVGAKQDNIAQSQQHYGIPSNFLISKKPSAVSTKKDRHSKIYTSQGLRDRRVRLSIDIARKFFDLQDMLGFDKASTTLDWLFTKSRKAIQELQFASHCKNTNISTAGCGGGASSSTDQDCCEEDEVVSDSAAVNEVRKLRRVEKEREKAKKESREKARARARERTSHRMCTTTAAAAAANTSKGKSLVVVGNDDDDDNIERGARDQEFKVIEESIVIKRKLKQPSNLMAVPSLSQNQIVDIPNKELPGFSNVNNATTAADYSSIFPNLSPNWDTNASIHGRSNICAIASMNLSTELQIFGKTWEECNNQRLH